jgi:Ca2+-transporting ATPase
MNRPAVNSVPTQRGLTSGEARRRLERFGRNAVVPQVRRGGAWPLVRRILTDPMTILLLVAAPTYLALRDYVSAAVVLAALVPVTGVTAVLEARAERALAELNRRAALSARVWRDGELVTIAAAEVVPGDRVALREGDVTAADGRLVEGLQLAIDEAALTGESQPAEKDPRHAPEIFGGTNVVSGWGTYDVMATGVRTRYGQVGQLLGEAREVPTRLQLLVRRLVVGFGAAAGNTFASSPRARLKASSTGPRPQLTCARAPRVRTGPSAMPACAS